MGVDHRSVSESSGLSRSSSHVSSSNPKVAVRMPEAHHNHSSQTSASGTVTSVGNSGSNVAPNSSSSINNTNSSKQHFVREAPSSGSNATDNEVSHPPLQRQAESEEIFRQPLAPPKDAMPPR